MPAALEPELVIVDLALDAPSALVVGFLPPILTGAASSSTLAVDEFYNATGKAPHLEAIIPKKESGWWLNYDMRKRKKAEERANNA